MPDLSALEALLAPPAGADPVACVAAWGELTNDGAALWGALRAVVHAGQPAADFAVPGAVPEDPYCAEPGALATWWAQFWAALATPIADDVAAEAARRAVAGRAAACG